MTPAIGTSFWIDESASGTVATLEQETDGIYFVTDAEDHVFALRYNTAHQRWEALPAATHEDNEDDDAGTAGTAGNAHNDEDGSAHEPECGETDAAGRGVGQPTNQRERSYVVYLAFREVYGDRSTWVEIIAETQALAEAQARFLQTIGNGANVTRVVPGRLVQCDCEVLLTGREVVPTTGQYAAPETELEAAPDSTWTEYVSVVVPVIGVEEAVDEQALADAVEAWRTATHPTAWATINDYERVTRGQS